MASLGFEQRQENEQAGLDYTEAPPLDGWTGGQMAVWDWLLSWGCVSVIIIISAAWINKLKTL